MTIYQGLTLLFGSGLLIAIIKGIYGKVKNRKDRHVAVELGIQAILRSQMISDYNKYSEKGFAPVYARENFENMYQRYHNLGANGVMNDMREKFLNLPLQKEDY